MASIIEPHRPNPGTSRSEDGQDTPESPSDPGDGVDEHAVDEHAYAYSALPSPSHFRLLKLHSSSSFNSSDELRCSLQVFEIESPSKPGYEAISYTWDPFNPRTVRRVHVVDELSDQDSVVVGELRVRENLGRILENLRSDDEDIWLWVDALCINQAAHDERNQQVRLMENIYKGAFGVIACLDSERNTEADVLAMQKVLMLIGGGSHRDLRKDLEGMKAWVAADEMHYWRRKWVIQEIALGRSVIVSCAGRVTSLSGFRTFAAALEHGHVEEHLHNSHIIRLTEQRSAQSYQRLHELLWRYRQHQCSEPVDHIYALFSLVGMHRQHLTVDYQQQPIQVYQTVMFFLREYDLMPKENTVSIAFLILKLLKLHGKPFEPYSPILQIPVTDFMSAAVSEFKQLDQQEETHVSIAQRRRHVTLQDIPRWRIEPGEGDSGKGYRAAKLWKVESRDEHPAVPEHRLTRRVMPYFKLSPDRKIGFDTFIGEDAKLFGFSQIPLEENDRIWHVWRTRYSLIVRMTGSDDQPQEASIVGRTHLFRLVDGSDDADFDWITTAEPRSRYGPQMVLNHRDLYQLAMWTNCAGNDDM